MKKSLLISLASLTLMSASFAHAGGGDWGDICSSTSCQLSLGTSIVIFFPTATTSAASDQKEEREAYIQAVQDDAAAYLAGADESAILQEAIRDIRAQTSATQSDQEIAAALIGR